MKNIPNEFGITTQKKSDIKYADGTFNIIRRFRINGDCDDFRVKNIQI
jgi:hypothetical protein